MIIVHVTIAMQMVSSSEFMLTDAADGGDSIVDVLVS